VLLSIACFKACDRRLNAITVSISSVVIMWLGKGKVGPVLN
jgi:hypothetical protein